MDKHVHAALASQVVDSVSDILQVCVRSCDDVDNTADLGLASSMRVAVVVAVMMVIVRFCRFSVIEPKAWYGVANYSTHLTKLLESDLDTVFQIVWHDQQQLLAGGNYQRYRRGENENGDDDGCKRIPQVPRLPQGHSGGDNDSQRAAGVCSDVQENAVHVVVVIVRMVRVIMRGMVVLVVIRM